MEEIPQIESQALAEARKVLGRVRHLQQEQKKLAEKGKKHVDVLDPVLTQVKDRMGELEKLEETGQVVQALLQVESHR